MKFQLSTALMGLAATAVSAQDQQSGPFALHVKGTNPNSTIDGYGGSCHAGAAISGLCYSVLSDTTDLPNTYQYWFNYTGYQQVDDAEVGTLTWNQPYTDQDGNLASVSQAMGLVYQTTSNVAAPLFGFSYEVQLVGFDSENELFGYSYVDDSKFVAGQQPPTAPKATYQWAVCWQYFTGYYYQSVAWVQNGAPHNPTCEPVEITKVDI
ncbi:hypothetical protein NPX13_g1300 [Xylaria arbuscula]|uniref:Uncharacterized protein n=1 Tax=Xylaria arbuscula TaxID=114810 RepID=A0A9W8TPS2_9PEZI|nr:hypothetical protein NPX13_g1300 [Xylaria arbuscula]